MSLTRYMLTTKDNPFDPFDEFERWFQYDVSKGYYSCGLVAERAMVSDGELSKEEDEEAIKEAIEEVIKEFPMIEFEMKSKEY